MKSKRTILLWAQPNMGKSTLAATIMERPSLTPCAYFDYDKSATSIAKYFGKSGRGCLFTVDVGANAWNSLMKDLAEVYKLAVKGEINSIVFDGLSAWNMDDVGLEQANNPDAVQAGGNAAMRLRAPPAARLNALAAKLHEIQRDALAEDFTIVLTAHAKMIGPMDSRYAIPDMSENAWIRIFRFCEIVLELKRVGDGAPRFIYKDSEHAHHRIKNPHVRAEFDRLAGNTAEIAKAMNIPNLLDLCERHEAGIADHYDRKNIEAAQAKTEQTT